MTPATEAIEKWVTRNKDLFKDDLEKSHLIDFLNDQYAQKNSINFSYEQGLVKAEKWLQVLVEKGKNQVELGNIKTVFKFENGSEMVQLLDDKARVWEGGRMGNCVGLPIYANKTIYSLRDSQGNSHCTIHIDDNRLRELNGPGNKSINTKHIKNILNFLNHIKVKFSPSSLNQVGYYSTNYYQDVAIQKCFKNVKTFKHSGMTYFYNRNKLFINSHTKLSEDESKTILSFMIFLTFPAETVLEFINLYPLSVTAIDKQKVIYYLSQIDNEKANEILRFLMEKEVFQKDDLLQGNGLIQLLNIEIIKYVKEKFKISNREISSRIFFNHKLRLKEIKSLFEIEIFLACETGLEYLVFQNKNEDRAESLAFVLGNRVVFNSRLLKNVCIRLHSATYGEKLSVKDREIYKSQIKLIEKKLNFQMPAFKLLSHLCRYDTKYSVEMLLKEVTFTPKQIRSAMKQILVGMDFKEKKLEFLKILGKHRDEQLKLQNDSSKTPMPYVTF